MEEVSIKTEVVFAEDGIVEGGSLEKELPFIKDIKKEVSLADQNDCIMTEEIKMEEFQEEHLGVGDYDCSTETEEIKIEEFQEEHLGVRDYDCSTEINRLVPLPHLKSVFVLQRKDPFTTSVLQRNKRKRSRNEPEPTFNSSHYMLRYICRHDSEKGCAFHPLFLVHNKQMPGDGSEMNVAQKSSIVWSLSICPSTVKEAGKGVWTNSVLPKGLVFGPFEAGYGWRVRNAANFDQSSETSDSFISNWLLFVNCSKTADESNMTAFRFEGEIYYKTATDIKRGTELMVWYRDEFLYELGDQNDAPVEEVHSTCRHDSEQGCAFHPLFLVYNKKTIDKKSKATLGKKSSTPWSLSICPSTVKEAGKGVWTNSVLPKGLVFGPFEAGYGWRVRNAANVDQSSETSDSFISNWLLLVNCSKTADESNMTAFRFEGNIYYKTATDIKRGTELMVWYGEHLMYQFEDEERDDTLVEEEVKPKRRSRQHETTPEMRATMIDLYEAGVNAQDIGDRLGISRNTVYRWVKRYQKDNSLSTLPRCGTPRKTTPEEDEKILNGVKDPQFVHVSDIHRELNIKCSVTTLYRRLQEAGYKYSKMPDK